MNSILVIDDEPASRLIVQSRLKDSGYQAAVAETGAQGLSEARGRGHDVFLVSAGLESGIDGSEVCRRLKAMPESQGVPVVLYSNRPVSTDELSRGYEAGCDYFLSKSEMPVLDHIVRVLLNAKSRLDDLGEQLRGIEGRSRRRAEEQQVQADSELAQRDTGEHSLVFRELAAGRPDGVLMVGPDGFVRMADRGACELLGSRIEGRNLGSLAPATGLEAFVRDARTDAREGFRFDLPARKGRAPRSLSASVVPLVSPPGEKDPGLRVVLMLDAGKRRLAAEMLRIQEPGVPRSQLAPLLEAARDEYSIDRFVGVSPQTHAVREKLVEALQTREPVLVLGEAGTGRARVARTLHYASEASGPFLGLHVPSVAPEHLAAELFGQIKGSTPEALVDRPGLCQLAKDGTLFLEEIGDLPKPIQERLLTALRSGTVTREGTTKPETVEFRLIASSVEPFAALSSAKRFLPALLEELSMRKIELAPLRDRPVDIQPLIETFLSRYGSAQRVYEMPDEVVFVCERYDWPGNVDELAHAVETACARCESGTITVQDLPRPLVDLHSKFAASELIPRARPPPAAPATR